MEEIITEHFDGHIKNLKLTKLKGLKTSNVITLFQMKELRKMKTNYSKGDYKDANIKFIKRSDIVKFLLRQNTTISEEVVFNNVMKSSSEASIQGFLVEALFEICVTAKCIPIQWSSILDGKYTEDSIMNDITNINDVNDKSINGKSGGKSDMSIKDGNKVITFSAKDWSEFKPGSSDIERLDRIGLKRESIGEDYKLGFVCKDKEKIINHGHQDSDCKKLFDKIVTDGLLFDIKDIKSGIRRFISSFSGVTYKDYCSKINANYLGNPRELLIEKLHQRITLLNFIRNLNNKQKLHLIAHKTRSGKSISQLLIIKYLLENNYNVLFMTSVPDTIDSFIDDLRKYVCFNDIDYMRVSSDNLDSICVKLNNLILCSIQFLKNDATSVKKEFLKKHNFQVMVIDECHYGSSTTNTRDNIIDQGVEEIRKNIKINIFSSGTPKKTQRFYKIPSNCTYEWTLYDEGQMKQLHKDNYENNDIISDMNLRHGSNFEKCLEDNTLDKDYTNMPTAVLMKAKYPDKIVNKLHELNEKSESNYCLDWTSVLTTSKIIDDQGNIVEKEEFEICKTIDGQEILENLLDNIISRDKHNNSIMNRVERKQWAEGSRSSKKDHPLLFIIYLPTHSRNGTISAIQKALCSFISEKGLWQKYLVEYSNCGHSMTENNEKYNDELKSIMKKTKGQGKRGCILFLGDKGSTGITYPDCDVSIHLDDGHNVEQQIQKRARPGTPAKGKKIYINVDMNVQRCLYTLSETVKGYQVGSKKNLGTKEIIKYLYETKHYLYDEEDFNNGNMNPIEMDNYFVNLSKTIANEINYIEILKSLCDELTYSDNELGKYIEKITNTPIQEINPNLQGEQQDLPKDEKIKHEIGKIIKETCETDEEKEILINDIILLQDKISDLMKSRRGLPYLGLLAKWFDNRNLNNLIDENEPLILSVLEPVIPNIHNNNIYKLYKLTMEHLIENNQDIVNQVIEMFTNASPCDYKKLVSKMFIPSEEERNEKGEVSTKPVLCVEMCDVHNNKWNIKGLKWLEPCCGKGNFILEIFDRLYNSLDIEDVEEKCRYIIEECLYFVDINELNVFICEVLLVALACSYTSIWKQDYNFNSEVCDSLQLDTNDIWGISLDEFHVIGNPPYSTDPSEQSPKALYNTFIEKYIEANTLLFVVPSRWFVGGKGLDKFRKFMMQRKDIKLIQHKDNALEWFDNVSIEGGVNYFLKDSNYNGLCKFNNESIDLKKYDCIIPIKYHKIIDEISKHDSIDKLYHGQGTYGITTNDKRLIKSSEEIKENYIKCYVSKKNGFINYIDPLLYIAKYNNNNWKVITARANGGKPNFGNTFIGKPGELCNQSYIFFEVNSEEKAESLKSYLETKFANYMLSIRKVTQDISGNTCKWIPLVPLDRIWSDDKVKEYFKFTEEQSSLY
tara:strand:- start:123 stop:4352 length:4230 start_codon:yes stop_codon:yes gene_type:complete